MKNSLLISPKFTFVLCSMILLVSSLAIFAANGIYTQDIQINNTVSTNDQYPLSSAVPTAPGPLLSSTWAVNTYSSVTALSIGFTNSSGHLGYSYVFDSNFGTEPNGWINMWVNSSYHASLTTGTYYLHVKANNTEGCSATTHYGPWYVDQNLPTNPLSGSSSSHSDKTWSNNASLTYSWSGAGDTGGSGLKGYAIRVETSDPGDFAEFTTSATSYKSDVPISGQYKVYIRSQDNVLNWASSHYSSSQTYYIDLSAPETSVINKINDTSWTSDWYNDELHANVSWYAPSDSGGSGIDGYSYFFTQNPGDIPDDTIDCQETQLWAVSSLLTQGVWYFHVKAKDNAGNWGSTLHSSAINIDTTNPTNPTISSCSHLIDGSWSSTAAFSISWSGAGDTGGSGVFGYHYILDTTSNTLVTTSNDDTPETTYETTLSSDGVYFFHVRAIDHAGNLADLTLHYGPIKFDNTPPTNPSTFVPDVARSTWSADRDFYIYWQGYGDGSGSGVEGFNYIWDTSATTTVPESSDPLDTLVNSVNAPDLYQSNSWYIHVRTRDNMGFWASSTAHYGPFFIDTFAPLNSSLSFDTPDPKVWYNESAIDIVWNDASDVGGSGIYGYSYVFDTSSGTVPDASPDTILTSYSTNSIPDGIYYFHIRSVDKVGNVSANTSHYGPYYFDATAPNNPIEDDLSCLSGHSLLTWSVTQIITIQWTEAWDYYSWIAGYSYMFSQNPSDIPDSTIDSNNTQVSSGNLGDSNSWYFIIRTRDNAGNWNTTTITIGPFYIDSNAPSNPTTLSDYNMTYGSDWHYDHYVEILWSGASDPAGGSGIQGYAVLWSHNPIERPDEVRITTDPTNISFFLDNSKDWYVHIITQDNAGLWSIGSYNIGSWQIDDAEPSKNPTVISTSHNINIWSATATIDFTWSNAQDSVSLIQGYSYVLDQNVGTVPDTTIDSSTLGWSSGSLSTANNYYFHIISCDNAGNWNMTVKTIGPFYIDRIKPSNPTTNVSSIPNVAIWTDTTSIYVQWSGAADSHSGVTKYYYHWVANPSLPSGTMQTGYNYVTNSSIIQGTWFFCVRSVDAVGNLADGYYTIGPFLVDKSNPNALLETDLVANHTINAWVVGESDHPYLNITWEAGTDVGGSGVAGYSYELNTEALDAPDNVMDTTGLEFISSSLTDSSTGWYFHIRVIDNVGFASILSTTIGPFFIDTTAPNAVTALASNRTDTSWNDESFSEYIRVYMEILYGGATDAGSGIAGYAWTFSMSGTDEAPTEQDTPIGQTIFITDKLTITGQYWFHIRVFDNMGLYSTTYTFGGWTIDVTPPNNPQSFSGTHADEWYTITSLSVTLIGTTDPGYGDFVYHIFMDTNPTAIGIPTSANLIIGNLYQNSSMSEGIFYIHVMAADTDSSLDPIHWNGTWYNIGPFMFDITNPSNPTSVTPSQPINEWGSSSSITISFVGASDSVSGIAGYSFVWTKNRFQAPGFTPLGTSYTNNSVEEGIYYLNIRSIDEAGNYRSDFYSSGPYKFDFYDPISNYTLSRSAQPNGWYFGYVDIDFDNKTNDVSGLEGLYYRINAGSWILITNLEQHVRIYDGVHEIEYYLKDNAGNSENVKSFELNIDTNTPQITTDLITLPNGGQFSYESGTLNIVVDLSDEWNIDNVVMRIYNASELVDTIILTEGIGGEYTAAIDMVKLGYGDYTFDLNVTASSGRFTFLPSAGSFSIISIPNAELLIYIILAVVGGVVAFAVIKVMKRRRPIKISGTISPQEICEQEKINAISSSLKQQKLTKLIAYVEGPNGSALKPSVEVSNKVEATGVQSAFENRSNAEIEAIKNDNDWIDQEIPTEKPALREISKSRIKQITVQKLDSTNTKAVYCPVCGHKEFIELGVDSDMKCPKCGQEKGILFQCPSCKDFFTMTVAETIESENFDIPCPSCNGAVIKPIKEEEN
jgi:hypothetical protein